MYVYIYLPIRKSNLFTDNEPLSAVPDKAFDGPNEQNEPSGQRIGRKAGEEAKSLADVLGDGKIVELDLGEIH